MTGITTQFRRYTAQGLKRTITGLAVFSCMAATAQTLLWSEDFDTGSIPDPAIWSYETGAGGWGNQEYQDYSSSANNVKVQEGNLVITARRTSPSTFTSGRIKTKNKLTFQYGTVEARIKTPDLANGLWPAFWTLGESYPPWPQCGEIDVLEMGEADAIANGLVNRRVRSTAHWGSIDQNGNHPNYGLKKDMPSDINDTFVIYKMEWTPSSITTYINDSQIWSMDINPYSNPDKTAFHEPHFFILNMAVGGVYTGIYGPGNEGNITAIPNTGNTAEYVIDYIRLYDNGHTIVGGTGLPNIPPEFTADPIVKPNAVENAGYFKSLAGDATDRNPDDILTFSKVSGPAWLNVGNTGIMNGSPGDNDVGLNSWIVAVSDGNGGTNTTTLEITVDNVNDDPFFTADPIVTTNAVEGVSYSSFSDFDGRTLADWAEDVDPDDTLTYSKVSGPAWLTVYPQGRLGGTPGSSDIGLNSWIVEVGDGNGGTNTTTLEITVDSASPPPTLNIQMAGSNLEVLWPSTYTTFSLYCTTNLLPPATWSAVTNTPALHEDDWMVTIPIAEAPPFFRLEAP